MKTIILIILSFITLNAQSRIIPFSSNPAGSTAANYVTDSLKYYWLYSSLTDGDITANEWEDETAALPFTNVDSDPNKGATGVVFDGNDDLYRTAFFTLNSGLSLELIIYIADSVATQGFATVEVDGVKALTFTLRDNPNAYGYNGTDGFFWDGWSAPMYQQIVHIIVTYDGGVSQPKLYLNGVSQTDLNLNYGVKNGSPSMLCLGYCSGNAANGTRVYLFRVYNKELSAGEVTTNYNSDSVQDILP